MPRAWPPIRDVAPADAAAAPPGHQLDSAPARELPPRLLPGMEGVLAARRRAAGLAPLEDEAGREDTGRVRERTPDVATILEPARRHAPDG